jgi:hypothetical protein
VGEGVHVHKGLVQTKLRPFSNLTPSSIKVPSTHFPPSLPSQCYEPSAAYGISQVFLKAIILLKYGRPHHIHVRGTFHSITSQAD